MTPDDLREAGETLFGATHWQTNLAMLLLGKRGSETSRVRNWLNGGNGIPAGVRNDLIKALRVKARAASALADRLADQRYT